MGPVSQMHGMQVMAWSLLRKRLVSGMNSVERSKLLILRGLNRPASTKTLLEMGENASSQVAFHQLRREGKIEKCGSRYEDRHIQSLWRVKND